MYDLNFNDIISQIFKPYFISSRILQFADTTELREFLSTIGAVNGEVFPIYYKNGIYSGHVGFIDFNTAFQVLGSDFENVKFKHPWYRDWTVDTLKT